MTYVVTAELNTVVALKYSGSGLDWGKWIVQPSGQVAVGTSEIFQACNRDGSTANPHGWVTYLADDGTEFRFEFADPLWWQNTCTSSMTNVHGPYYLPKPEYPASGDTWTVTYYISTMTDFCDLPVDSEHVIRAWKCSEYGEDRVRGMFGEHKVVHLSGVLNADIPAEAKLWCVMSPLFLTPVSKAILIRDLAQFAVADLTRVDAISPSLLDSALLANHEFQQGSIGVNRLQSLRRLLEERAQSVSADQRDMQIVGLVATLTEKDPVNGWIHAVSSYLSGAEGAEMTRRIAEVLRIVQARLKA